MPERYRKEFESIYESKKKADYKFFYERSVKLDSGENWKYLVCHIDLDILKCALELAKEKSNYTMVFSQASIPRSMATKIKKCCQGVLAEMFVHFLLLERYNLKVLRYDLERKTFQYNPEEYDLMILEGGEEYEVEVRSSNIHHREVAKFVENDVLIGPYTNSLKKKEELASFFFRPIYMPEFRLYRETANGYRYAPDLFNGEAWLVITGMATSSEMIKYGKSKSLGQYGTTYTVVDAKKVGDVDGMDQKMIELFGSGVMKTDNKES